MTYREYQTTPLVPMEILDKLITAGLGDRKGVWDITESEFNAAMAVTDIDLRPKTRTVPEGEKIQPGDGPKLPHRWMEAAGRRKKQRERTEVFPSRVYHVMTIRPGLRQILRAE